MNLKSARAEVSRKNIFFGRKYGVSWRERSSDFSFFSDLKNIALRKKEGWRKDFFSFFSLDFPRKKGGENNMGVRLCVLGYECVWENAFYPAPLSKEREKRGKPCPYHRRYHYRFCPSPMGPGKKVKDFYPVFTCGEAGRSRHAQCCSSYCCWGDHFGLPMCFQKRCVQRGHLPCPCAFKKVCSERCVQRGVFREVHSERCVKPELTSKFVTSGEYLPKK